MRKLILWTSVWIGLVLIDTLTKIFGHTPDWAMHTHDSVPLWLWTGPLLFAIPILWSPVRFGGIIASAGAFGNTAWKYNEEGVPNPFQDDTGILAFNFADVCLLLAEPILIISVFIWMTRTLRREWIRTYHDRSIAEPSAPDFQKGE